MKIAIGSDHAGFEAKEQVKLNLQERGHQILDMGPESDTSVDYPDYAHRIARAVASGECERGIAVCGTGLGMSYAANRHAGVRAALCHSVEVARLSREHNDANALCLGARINSPEELEQIVSAWMETAFAGGRHITRVAKIELD